MAMAARVLIIFPGALGDLICLAPTIHAITRRHRGAEIELMARMELAEFAVGRLRITRAHSIDRRDAFSAPSTASIAGSAPMIRASGALCWMLPRPARRRSIAFDPMPRAT